MKRSVFRYGSSFSAAGALRSSGIGVACWRVAAVRPPRISADVPRYRVVEFFMRMTTFAFHFADLSGHDRIPERQRSEPRAHVASQKFGPSKMSATKLREKIAVHLIRWFGETH
jgi:hypothetical protein